MAGNKRSRPDPGATMQIDAIVDQLEDLGDSDFGPAPPPLPPKRASKAMWIVGALVVLLMAGLGVGLGVYLFGGSEPAPAAVAAPPAPALPAPAPAAPEPAVDRAEPQPDVVQMDEVVFGAEEPAPAQ
jgi:hypothetical protein